MPLSGVSRLLMLMMLVGVCGERAAAQDVGAGTAAGDAELQKFLDMRFVVSTRNEQYYGSPPHAQPERPRVKKQEKRPIARIGAKRAREGQAQTS